MRVIWKEKGLSRKVGHWVREEEREKACYDITDETFGENKMPNINFNRMLCATYIAL